MAKSAMAKGRERLLHISRVPAGAAGTGGASAGSGSAPRLTESEAINALRDRALRSLRASRALRIWPLAR